MSNLPVLTRKCDDDIAELEHLHRQGQAKITELSLQLEKVRVANEQLAEQCKENDALKAYIEELKSDCLEMIGGADDSEPFDVVVARIEYDVLCRRLNESPSICLAELKANTIEDLIQHMHDEYNGESMDQFFQAYADQLREGAKDE